MTAQQRGEPLRRILALHEEGGERRIERVARDAAAPEVVRRLLDELAVVAQRFERERHMRRERRVGQRALAKAVDREDRRFVEGLQRTLRFLYSASPITLMHSQPQHV